jgi:F-type H+-transporting ATPase subunit gamma
MAGGQERILRRRIRTVQATKKITRAMELIAASRIVKAQARVQAAVPYANGITEVVRNLQAAGGGASHPMLIEREQLRRVGHVVMTADRGLCGAYNTAVIRATEAEIRDHDRLGHEYELVTVGRKAESYFRFRNFAISAVHAGFSDNPSYEDARAIAKPLIEQYEAGQLDRVQLVYTRFITAGRQEIVVRSLLPLADEDLVVGGRDGGEVEGGYEFEPDPDEILDRLLPRYAEARVYAALLNAAASEHAARQRAMKAATDNAEELIRGLTRTMNRARQDAITTEIMEIVGGAEALRAGASTRDDAIDDEYFDKSA